MVEGKYDKEKKIAKILKATEFFIREVGYSNMTTNKIAEKADVSIGLLYKYFPHGKPDLVCGIMRKLTEEKKEVPIDMFLQGENYQEVLKNFIKMQYMTHISYRSLVIAQEMVFMEEPEVVDELVESFRTDKSLSRYIWHILEEKGLDVSNIDEFSKEASLNMIDALTHRQIIYNLFSDDEDRFAEFIFDVFMGYITRVQQKQRKE